MKKKNIVFICTDQHRTDTLSAYCRDTVCRTPNLDALAAESVVFDHAYASNPVCSPARCSMQTGLYPSKTGMETNLYQTGTRTHELQDTDYLLSRRLLRAGYTAAYTGKWHLGFGRDKEASAEGQILLDRLKHGSMEGAAYMGYGTLPTDVGYLGDDFPGHGNGGWAYPQYQEYLRDHGLTLEIINQGPDRRPGDHSFMGEVVSPVETTIEYYVTERAIRLTEEMAGLGKPFFMNLNFWGPHEPFFAPSAWLDVYRHMELPPWPSFEEPAENMPRIYEMLRRPEKNWTFFQETLRHYYACVSHIDSQIGRYLTWLKDNGLYDDTVILFSADHGDNQGCHGKLENKSYGMYDDTARIPLMIKPAADGAEIGEGLKGYHQKALVGTCDIYATILGQAGFVPEDDHGFGDGRDLSGFITNPEQAWSDEIVTEGMGALDIVATQRMYRKGRYKYIFTAGDMDQLFDLEADPFEMNNLARKAEWALLLLEMKNSFADWMKRHRDPAEAGFCKINRIGEWAVEQEEEYGM
ncbi:MAG: sulfatase-like hydrolase/transferase [Clostridiaceae bacterium]|nr:sulfatase-like hydrolase/transferase [Clostridiaceae bacterium]